MTIPRSFMQLCTSGRDVLGPFLTEAVGLSSAQAVSAGEAGGPSIAQG